MEFSCIGDPVNLASRVEGLTKFYGITIMITEHTLQEIKDLFITREIETVIVTGKKTGCRMFELLGKKGDHISDATQKTLDLYRLAYEIYKNRKFQEAADLFSAAVTLSDDGPSKVLLERCKHFVDNPPPPEWNSVYTSTN